MANPRLPFIRPCMPSPEAWIPFLRESYAANRFSNFGPANRLLERRLTEKYGVDGRVFVLTSSATTGLTTVLLALGIRGQVVLPAFTFPATLQAVRMAGCTPVLCDVDPDTWEMSTATLEPVLKHGRIQAVIPVRAFGFCRDLQPVVSMCNRAGIQVVVDSAAAFGGQLDAGSWVGAQGSAEVFSFHATKVFGIGEGGVISVDAALAERVRSALNFGIQPVRVERGLNGKLSEFAAAVGLAVLERMDDFTTHRRAFAARYSAALLGYPELTLPAYPGNPVWQCYPVLLPERWNANDVVEQAQQAGVEIRRYYRPALACDDDTGTAPPSLDVSKQLADGMICLAIYSDMTLREQDDILDVMGTILSGR